MSPSFNRLTSFIGKVDHSFNTNNILTGRYFFGDSVQSFPLSLTASGGQLPGFNTYTPTRVQLVSISYVHTIGSNKVNELRVGWNRFAEGFFPADQSFQPSSIGLNTGAANAGLPIMDVSGYAQLGSTGSVPRHRVDSNDQVLDNFSWKVNGARFQVWLRLSPHHHSAVFRQGLPRGSRFRGRGDGSDHDQLRPIADFLAGNVDGGFQYFGNSLRHTSERSYGLYLQDNYRVTPRLTLNYGLRWDYFGVVSEKNNLFSNITSEAPAAGTGTFTLTQVGQGGLSNLYKPDYKNIAPRVSMAWDVTGKGKTVLRAGYGIFFDSFSQDVVLAPFAVLALF